LDWIFFFLPYPFPPPPLFLLSFPRVFLVLITFYRLSLFPSFGVERFVFRLRMFPSFYFFSSQASFFSQFLSAPIQAVNTQHLLPERLLFAHLSAKKSIFPLSPPPPPFFPPNNLFRKPSAHFHCPPEHAIRQTLIRHLLSLFLQCLSPFPVFFLRLGFPPFLPPSLFQFPFFFFIGLAAFSQSVTFVGFQCLAVSCLLLPSLLSFIFFPFWFPILDHFLFGSHPFPFGINYPLSFFFELLSCACVSAFPSLPNTLPKPWFSGTPSLETPLVRLFEPSVTSVSNDHPFFLL